MSDSIAPESRIFRIGRECYIVYLGKERDDIKPFLRIGNTREIPDEVYDVVSTTVVTDDHVGNPLLEIQNSSRVHGRYLGDTAVVGEIRRFFKSFDLPTDDVTDYRKVKDGEKRHMVWFYSSGNIHLRYDDQVIFDMDRREKADRHFIRLYEEAKAEFLRNPLRYIKQDFNGPGMVLSGGNAFWYEGGEMLALEAHSGFVARLMNDGVDPDFITTSCFDLDADSMDSHDSAVFIGFVKRMRQRRKQLRVLTAKPELQRKLRLLFPARGEVPATLDVTDVSGKKKATFRDSIINRRDGAWMIHRAGVPEVCIGGKVENGISVDVENGILSIHKDGEETRLRTPQGCPIDFVRQSPPENQVVDKYIGLVYNQLKDHFGSGEAQAATVLEKYVRMFRDDVQGGKASASPLLKQTSNAARDGVRRANVEEGSASWYFYSNVLTVLEILRDRAGKDHPLAKNADPVITALENLLSRIPAPEVVHPFWADLYVEGVPRLLWRAAKRGYVPADVESAQGFNDRIGDITSLDETPWHEEKERLLLLIRSLGEGGKGPLTDDQLALLKKPDEEPAAAPERKKEAAEPVAPGGTSGQSARDRKDEKDRNAGDGGDKFSATGKKSGSGGSRSGRRTWLWILLLLLLLLIGGAVVWDLTGSAPWGSILRSEAGTDDRDQIGSDDQPGKDEPGEVKPGEDKPGEVKPGEDKPGEVKPGEDKPGEVKPGEDKPGEVKPGEVKPGEVKPGEVKPGEDKPGEDKPGEDKPGDDDRNAETKQIDPDVAPVTAEQFDDYLNIDGRVSITEADIHLAANEIAVLNGYKDLDFRVYTGEDPDWIYPGNVLKLPEGDDYNVRKGDTIWFLAAREVRIDVTRDLEVYDAAVSVLKDSASSGSDRDKAMGDLRTIAEDSKAEDMRFMAAYELTSRQ